MTYDLHELVRENKVDDIQEAIEKGADINVQDERGNTPLLLAFLEWAWSFISMNNEGVVTDELIECLLNYNPDVTIANEDGTTPLHAAVLGDNIKFIKALIERGAKVNARDKILRTPLLKVLEKNNGYALEVIKCLLERGADINARDNYGKTVLHQAVECCFREEYKEYNMFTLIKYLLQSGADINAQYEDGFTPFMIAVYNSVHNETHIALLLRYNPDVTIKDKEGRTAISYMSSRIDLSDSIKGMILLRSVPGLRRWRLESFINAFRMQSPFPGELYNAITPEFIALVHPEIPLDKKLRWLEAYDEEVLGIGKEQASEEEQALPYEIRCRP
jgi:ankyrin repeat protein